MLHRFPEMYALEVIVGTIPNSRQGYINIFLLTVHVVILLYNKEPAVRNFSSVNLLLIWEELNPQETDFLIS